MMMQEIYKAPELTNYYCRNECPLGADVQELSAYELDRITIKMLVSLNKAADMKEQLLNITEDGVITQDELPTLNSIIQNLDHLSNLAQSLKLWVQRHME